MCSSDSLYVVKGRLEGAAGSRFLTVQLTNVGDDACSAGTATKAAFRDWSGPLGVKGALSAGSGAVTLDPGETATTVIHWSDPGPVPADDCQEAAATLVTVRVPSLKHTWRIPLKAAGLHDLRVPPGLRAADELTRIDRARETRRPRLGAP